VYIRRVARHHPEKDCDRESADTLGLKPGILAELNPRKGNRSGESDTRQEREASIPQE
jgi:hypothetical protein